VFDEQYPGACCCCCRNEAVSHQWSAKAKRLLATGYWLSVKGLPLVVGKKRRKIRQFRQFHSLQNKNDL
jgi:hypothetical protein